MTTLEKWVPLPDLDLVERRMHRLFEDLGVGPVLTPPADIYESGSELVVELDVPGFDEKELKVAVSDHMLTITGERTEESTTTEKAFRRRERLEARFERRFQLPTEADTEHVTAEVAKGVLTLHVPKTAAPKPRTIEIGTEK